MKKVNRDNILEMLNCRKRVKVEFEGFEFYCCSLTVKESLEVEAVTRNCKDDQATVVRTLVKYACVDEDGNKLFTDDVLIDKMPSALAAKIFECAEKLNGGYAEDVETKTKN